MSWETMKLSDLVSFRTGKLNSNAAVENGEFPFFTCSREVFKTNTFAFDTECVLLGGNNANGVFPIWYFEGKFDAYQRTYVIEPLDRQFLNTRFFFYALQLKLQILQSHSAGATTKYLTLGILNGLEVDIPPTPIQKRITEILSAYDDLIDNNNRRIALLEEAIHRLYREWFVHLRFPGHEHTPVVAGVPVGWEKRPLSDLVSTQYGYTESAQDEPVGPKYLRGTDINKTSYIDWSTVPYCPIDDDVLPKFKLDKYDILMIRMADPGKVGIVEKEIEAVFASYLVRLKPTSDELTPYYLFYFLSSHEYQGFITGASTGATRKSASATLMTSVNIMVPSHTIQQSFADYVVPMRQQITNLLNQNEKLREARDALLPRLMNGSLPV